MGSSTTGKAEPAKSDERSALSFGHVSKVFPDGTHALDDITFSLNMGDFVTVVGPSGCGKSTLLRIASGLDRQTSGAVHLNTDNVGYVFQDATLMPWRTVQKNVELLAELHGIDKPTRQRLAAEAIAKVGLEGFQSHFPKALSGGMKMRVSLARSLTLQPPIFLFDEPFGALDEINRERLNDETLELFVRERFAALFITHSIYEAVFLSTRVLVMSERPGHIIGDFGIPFPYPRPHELRFEADFAELTGAVSAALRGAFRTAGPPRA
jgi:NitT/TauT family transport system ATP-binding protein